MPFTFSHPAIVLPAHSLLRKRVSLTGLLAGSVVPDFEYFVRVFHKSHYSHTIGGLFYADLPAALLLCFLYHNLVRGPFYLHTPLFLKRRMAPFQTFNWNRWFAAKWRTVLLSILAGAASHLLWDKLTHHSVPMVQAASGFQTFVTPEERHMTYFLFWDLSSLIGGFFVLYAIWQLPAANVVSRVKSNRYWLFCWVAAFSFFFVQLPCIRRPILDDMVISLINSLLLGILFASLAFAFRRREKHKTLAGAKKQGQRFRHPL